MLVVSFWFLDVYYRCTRCAPLFLTGILIDSHLPIRKKCTKLACTFCLPEEDIKSAVLDFTHVNVSKLGLWGPMPVEEEEGAGWVGGRLPADPDLLGRIPCLIKLCCFDGCESF